jgi:lysophospholipase L1-like esterase
MTSSMLTRCVYVGVLYLLLIVGSMFEAFGQHVYGSNSTNRPLEILAIGDSVVWGQGLEEGNKFSVLVKTWLQSRVSNAGRKVNLHYADAHSGATILPELPLMSRRRYHGEINVSSPSIVEQVDLTSAHYLRRKQPGPLATGNVDLILLDGCINDTKAINIALADPDEIERAAKLYCFDAMRNQLLPKVIKTYPNANIIVTGYFPLFSDESEQRRIYQTLIDVFGIGRVLRIPKAIRKDRSGLLKLLSKRSKAWVDASNDELEKAVKSINADQSLPGSSQFTDQNQRVHFVRVPFTNSNAYGAKDSWLWELNKKGKSIDNVVDIRSKECDAVKWKYEFICRRASTFHPNEKGARAYAAAIQTRLEQLLPHVGWHRIPSSNSTSLPQ